MLGTARDGVAELFHTLSSRSESALLIISLATGVAAFGFGMAYAWPDPWSVGFVSVATVAWLLFGLALLAHARQVRDTAQGEEPPAPEGWLPAGQAVLVSIGLFGTFVGLSMGLYESIPCIDERASGHAACLETVIALGAAPAEASSEAMQYGMSELLGGARLAFSKSVAGIGLGLSYLLMFRLFGRRRQTLLRVLGRRRQREAENRRAADPTLIELRKISAAVLAMSQTQVSIQPVVDELWKLRAAQPEPGLMTRAAQQMADGGAALGSAAQNLETLRADVIGETVAAGVKAAVASELAPTLDAIRVELGALRNLKKESDELVRQQLAALIDDLHTRALAPITEEIRAVNGVTTRVTEQVEALGKSVASSSEAVRQTTVAMGQLTEQMTGFQQKALQDLKGFATDLDQTLTTFTTNSSSSFREMGADIKRSVEVACTGMESQRTAFESSAEQARLAFEAQTNTITVAGNTAAQEIERAGSAARDALQTVRGEFAEALGSQRAALQDVLTALDGAFRQDLAHRQEFERVTEQSVQRVQLLLQRTAAMEASLSQATPALLLEMTQSVQQLSTQAAAQRADWDRVEDALAIHLEKLQASHRGFLETEDVHLTNVLGNLHQLVTAIADSTQVLASRSAHGVGATRP